MMLSTCHTAVALKTSLAWVRAIMTYVSAKASVVTVKKQLIDCGDSIDGIDTVRIDTGYKL